MTTSDCSLCQEEQDIRSKRGISASALISEESILGEDVTIGAGAVLVGRCEIGDRCMVGPGVVLDAGEDGGRLVLEPDSHVLASSTVAMPVRIGRGSRIQPGAVIIRDVPPYAIVAGNPAHITGYAAEAGTSAPLLRLPPDKPTMQASGVRGVTFHRLPKILDLRGNLTVGEFGKTLPFLPKRYFMVFGVPNAEIRGEHAHRTCEQFLICAHGSCSVMADDGIIREEFLLDDPSLGLYLPPLTWGVQYKYSPDAVLLVFASEFYDASEYIRDYGEFMALSTARMAAQA